MENETRSNQDQYLVYTDIISLFKLASEVSWFEVRQNSVYRILYLSSVLYSFIHPDKENPFSLYNFTVNPTGPYASNIAPALDFLIKDDYIARSNSGKDIFTLGKNPADEVFKIEQSKERFEWLRIVVYILGIYGENKIYDFIFRDPEYQTHIKSNSQKTLNTTESNATVKTLKAFQFEFEKTLQNAKDKISPQRYLELYFEYIFSKILKRED